MHEFGIEAFHLDGCAYGLTSQVQRPFGTPIRKPWTIASDLPAFATLRRTCPHAPAQHTKCAGADTSLTAGYTDELATAIHAVWSSHVTPATTHPMSNTSNRS